MADTERAELIPENADSPIRSILRPRKAWKWPLKIHIDRQILSAAAVVRVSSPCAALLLRLMTSGSDIRRVQGFYAVWFCDASSI